MWSPNYALVERANCGQTAPNHSLISFKVLYSRLANILQDVLMFLFHIWADWFVFSFLEPTQ